MRKSLTRHERKTTIVTALAKILLDTQPKLSNNLSESLSWHGRQTHTSIEWVML